MKPGSTPPVYSKVDAWKSVPSDERSSAAPPSHAKPALAMATLAVPTRSRTGGEEGDEDRLKYKSLSLDNREQS